MWVLNDFLYAGAGRERYSQNLALLIPFFKSPSLVLENIQKVTIEIEINAIFCSPLDAGLKTPTSNWWNISDH